MSAPPTKTDAALWDNERREGFLKAQESRAIRAACVRQAAADWSADLAAVHTTPTATAEEGRAELVAPPAPEEATSLDALAAKYPQVGCLIDIAGVLATTLERFVVLEQIGFHPQATELRGYMTLVRSVLPNGGAA